MKLSLSLPALERLLGGDTELELELRHQIAKEFTSKHLMELTKSEAYQQAMLEIRRITNEAVKEEVGTLIRANSWAGTTEKSNLKTNIKSMIDQAVSSAVNETLNKCVQDKIGYYERSWGSYIDRKVKEVFDKSIGALVQDEINRRLKIAAETK